MADQPVIVPIEDDDMLYYRVVGRFISRQGSVSSSAFKFKDNTLRHKFSTDAEKLTTARECLERPSLTNPNLRGMFKLACFYARTPRSLDFDVWHDPENG